MSEEIEVSTEGALGRIVLNRPAAINALSLAMIEAIAAALAGWRADAAIGAVLVEGNGPKGFCAGGDVRAVRAAVLAGTPEAADAYFAAEYGMNALIAGYGKPLVALTHGVVMGGGIGIAGHCGMRITQPGARFAMPEAAIGFFGDVGANAILAKAPLKRALLFLMSGVSVGAADAVALGLADMVVDPERVAMLRADIAGAAGSVRPAEAIVRLMQAEAIEAGEAGFCALADLLPAGTPASPAAFLAEVAGVPELAELSALLAGRSPGSLAAIFHSQMAARRLMDVEKTLAMELRLAAVMARRPDFAEGVRAVLVDRDQAPRWQPAALQDLDEGPIRAATEGG
jgi:enoyl-CoA hydratase